MKTRNRRKKGFTLVELLVVISIIGMLMALLLPAVQAARESGRANTCRNNMRNLALAVIQYETNRSAFPGYSNDIDPSFQLDPFDDNDTRSWTFVILPYMDHRSLFDKYKNFDNGDGPTSGAPNSSITEGLEITVCPSNPPDSLGGKATSYVVNTGQIDRPSTFPLDFQANGVFHHARGKDGSSAISMSTAYIAGQDGLGTTLMMSENADANDWTDVEERLTGFTYHHGLVPATSPDAGSLGLNMNFGQRKTSALPNEIGWARPSSYHPNGMNFVFCDGHVRFMTDTIAYGVYQALMTPRGSAAIDHSTGVKFTAGHPATQVVDENALN